MTIDLDLAAYAAGKANPYSRPTPKPRELFPRRRFHTIQQNRGERDRVMKSLRDSTWRRHEHHQKQLQHFIDRERFQENETWRAEYERLASVPPLELAPDVYKRMGDLRDAIVNKPDPKSVLLSKAYGGP